MRCFLLCISKSNAVVLLVVASSGNVAECMKDDCLFSYPLRRVIVSLQRYRLTSLGSEAARHDGYWLPFVESGRL
ncbi:hypothetical protein GGI42DRAFT_130956 [Trichoderma sp. SZMC 28013]